MLNLLRHPAELARVRADQSLVPRALDEALRFDYIATSAVPRYAKEDTEIAGVKIRARQMVIPLVLSALRDLRAFTRPDTFDVRRPERSSLSFGAGPHYCIGEPLAKLEGQIAIEALLRRFPHMSLGGEPKLGFHPMMRPIEALPVALGARA